MKTRIYTLKGKEVPSSLAGAAITFREPETMADVALLAKDEASQIELAAGAYDVWLQGRLRAMAAAKNEDGSPKHTSDSLNAFAASAQYARREAGVGGSREVKPETRAKRAATNSGNKLFEKCRDPQQLAKFVKLGVVDEAEFGEWLAANPAPETVTA